MRTAINILILSLLTGCMVTKTQTTGYKEAPGKEVTHDKAKQFWIVWGAVPINRARAEVPSGSDFEVVTKRKFVDCLITVVTAGFVQSYSINVNVKHEPTN